MTFSGKVKIDVGLPGQDGSFVTLEIVWAHVRMEVAPVVVHDGWIVVGVSTFVGDIAVVAGGPNIRRNGWGLDAGKAGHTGELLSRGGFGDLELPVDVIGSGGGKRERCAVRVGPCKGCANVLLPEFAEVAELYLPGSHAGRGDSSRGGGKLIMHIDLAEIHEDVLANETLSIVVGEEWDAVRGDAGNDVGVVEAHATKGRGEAFSVIRLAGVAMCRWIIGHALGDGRRIVEGGVIGRVAELRGRN